MSVRHHLKTANLTGVALAYAVALAQGLAVPVLVGGITIPRFVYTDKRERACKLRNALALFDYASAQNFYHPDSDWSIGGPLMERYNIDLTPPRPKTGAWLARVLEWPNEKSDAVFSYAQYGESPLQAAMRCLIAQKLGRSVMIPDQLHE